MSEKKKYRSKIRDNPIKHAPELSLEDIDKPRKPEDPRK